ncbi:MAG: hypothetical protein EXX96DRAFT_6481 [Benjaminiella poitrasii]|nr:MAG: hypothetical protein EXX96DRAFT_6481 [Benjaminiella poitrasii]
MSQAQVNNRSFRRRLTRNQTIQERREMKKMMRNAPNGANFNPKKSGKVAPSNAKPAQETPLIKKKTVNSDSSTDCVETVNVPAVIDVAGVIKDERSKQPEMIEKEDLKENVEKVLDEIKESQSSINESEKEIHTVISNIKQKTEVIDDIQPTDNLSLSQDTTSSTNNNVVETAEATPTVNISTVSTETETVTVTEAHEKSNDTSQESTEELKKEKTDNVEPETVSVQQESLAASSLSKPMANSDKTPSSETSSKKKTNLISKLFKHKSVSKKKEPTKTELTTDEANTAEKKKKEKAWKIWKKL